MARRPPRASVPQVELQLTESAESARSKLEDRVAKGEALERPVRESGTLEQFRRAVQEWSDYNDLLLRRLFTTEEIRDEYARRIPAPISYFDVPTPGQLMQRELQVLGARLASLRSIIGRLDLIHPGPGIGTARAGPAQNVTLDLTKAFIVHGHDQGARDAVARVLKDLDIEPVVLFEKPSGGMTVIEKLERYSNVGFAVVLLTPDDQGQENGAATPRARARQNVVLELGYFLGKLTRPRVCPLYKADVELPSDYHGVVYVAMDDAGAWKYKLAGELKLAGYEIDKNKIS